MPYACLNENSAFVQTQNPAESGILEVGPDPDFVEPGGIESAEGFSTCLEHGPFPLGHPEEYACGKTKQFPEESGPAIVAIEVPDEIVALAINEAFPLSQGIVQFDAEAGLQELRACWPELLKEIRPVTCP